MSFESGLNLLPIIVKGNGGFRTENTGKVTLERRPGLARCGLQPVIPVLEERLRQ